MSQFRTHYDNLQVKETASEEVIKGAYRYLSQKWHPDRNPDNRQEAERALKIINQAYAVLSDPLKRKEHDEWIKRKKESESRPTQSPPPPSPPPLYAQQQRKEEFAAPSRMVRPWVRYWARTLDTYTFGMVAGAAIVFAYPDAFSGETNDQLYVLILLFAWIFAESIFLSTMGTTPGKWLFRTKIEHQSGSISFNAALSRSFKVWWRGMGIGFPLATQITNLVAYKKLTKNGETTWDADSGFTVTHGHIGAVRVIAAVLIFSVFLLLIAASAVPTSPPAQSQNTYVPSSYDKLLMSYERQYPQINPDSPHFDKRLTDQIANRMSIYRAGGHSDDDALKLAVSDFFSHNASQSKNPGSNNLSQNKTPGSYSPSQSKSSGSLNASQGCVIKPVMTDEDYRRCGITPPGAR